MRRRPSRHPLRTVAVFAVAVIGCAGCGRPSKSTAVPVSPPTGSVAVSPATRPGPTSPPTIAFAPNCTNASVLATWPLSRLAAQLIVSPVLDYNTTSLDAAVAGGMGGILFIGRAMPPPALGTVVRSFEPPAGTPPPLVMADEEGGVVQRLLGSVQQLPSARQVAATDSPTATQALGLAVGNEMLRAGVDVDLAPVLDVDAGAGPSASNPDGTRSYSGVAAVVARYGLAMLDGLRSAGVLPVVKHFPGLGGSSGDTDYGPATTPDLATLRTVGLIPFRAAISAGAPAVMVSNAAVPGLSALPSSLSAAVVTGLLRRDLGFTGLVLTDSLSAGAIAQAGYDLPAATAAAVAAGADMVLWGSTLTPVDTAALSPHAVEVTDETLVQAIITAVRNRSLTPAQVDDAALAVITAKRANLCANIAGTRP